MSWLSGQTCLLWVLASLAFPSLVSDLWVLGFEAKWGVGGSSASKTWACHPSPAQPAGSSQPQRQSAFQNAHIFVVEVGSPNSRHCIFKVKCRAPFHFKGKQQLWDHVFYLLYDRSSPLAQWENVVGMQLENRLQPTGQMNHNWVWDFSKLFFLTLSFINENQRKCMAGMAKRPSTHVCC